MAVFEMKKIAVPGLVSDGGLALNSANFIDSTKTLAGAAPPNTSAVDMADTVMNEIGKSGFDMPGPRDAKLQASDSLALENTKKGWLGGFGAITNPDERATEREGQADFAGKLANEARTHNDELVGATFGKTIDELTEEFGGAYARQFKPGMTEDEIRAIVEAADAGTASTEEADKRVTDVAGAPLPSQYWWRSAIEGAVKSAAQMGTNALRAPGAWFESGIFVSTGFETGKSWPRQAADALDAELNKGLPADPGRREEAIQMLSEGVGSMAPYLLAGYVGQVLGVGAGATTGAFGAAAGGGAQYEDADRFDANGWSKFTALVLGSGLGMTDRLPIERAFMRAEIATGGLVSRVLRNTTATSLSEFTQEVGQAAGEDIIAKYLPGYDPDRVLDYGDWFKQGLVGAVTGGGVGFVTTLAPGKTVDMGGKPEAVQAQIDKIIDAEQQVLDGLTAEVDANPEDGEAANAEAVDAQPAGGAGAPQATDGVGAATAPTRVDPVVAGDAVKQIVEQQRAYHGTPHKFDKFSMDKIGTGEGAQAFGHGLYFAGNRQVAEGYRAALARPVLTVDGSAQYSGISSEGLTALNFIQQSFSKERGTQNLERAIETATVDRMRDRYTAAREWLRENDARINLEGGALYQVDIPDDAELLDWDAPLSTQSAAARAAIQKLVDAAPEGSQLAKVRSAGGGLRDSVTGEQIYRGLSADLRAGRVETPPDWSSAATASDGSDFGGDQAASATLLAAGVPGLRYLDAGSRADGDGTRNYVIFDENRIQIEDVEAQVGQPVNPDIVAQVDAVQLDPYQVAPLPNIEKGLTGPIPRVVQAAKAYAAAIGLPHRRARSYVKVDTARAARIAAAYTAMKHEPNDPAVLAAYQALADETVAQYQYVKATGLKIETILPWKPAPLSAKAQALDVKVTRTPSEIGKGYGDYVTYTEPSGGVVRVVERKGAAREASVVDFVIPEALRGQGIGRALMERVLADNPSLMGQVSSRAAAKLAYDMGRRPFNQPDATLEDIYRIIESDSSVNLLTPELPDPYPNGPRDVLKDINAGHIWYFPTDQGFGSSEFDPTGNPLLEASGETSDNGQPMVVNDLFRVVHDFFGHGLEGSGFGARGEENAWQSHMRLFTASAVPAMTSETRGQNSWVNYGPFGEQNRKDPRNTVYADQKTGIMPSWTWTEGVVDSTAEDVDAPVELTGEGLFYHGTSREFEGRLKLPGARGSGGNAVFLSTSPVQAITFARGETKRLLAAKVNAKKVFNYQSETDLAALSEYVAKNFDAVAPGALYGPQSAISFLRSGDFGLLEQPAVRKWMRSKGYDSFWVREYPDSPLNIGVLDPAVIEEVVSPQQQFLDAFLAAKNASPFGAAAYAYSPAEYAKMRTFLAPDGLSGFALKGTDIVSVFSHPAAGGGRLRKIIDVAVANGGKTLDAFDGKLVQMYAALGFREVRRENWNDQYRPEGWKAEWGKPDVVYMEYSGDIEQAVASLGTESPAFLEWDGGAAIRDDDGVPLVLYSGAPKSLRKATREMWMTPDRDTASQFGEASMGGNFANDAQFDEDGNNIGGAVFTFYARMENPLEIDWQGNSWNAGPDTEYPTIYRAVDSVFESYGDAEQAISDQQDSARNDAEEAFREDMANRMYVAEVGEQFEVRLKAEQGDTVADLEYRVSNARTYEASRREALDKAIAQQDTLGAALVESVRNQYKTAIAQLAEFQRQLEALRTAPPVEDEVIGTFDTEEGARDFENEYTEERATEAGDAAADEVDTGISEETDYDVGENGQTTDGEVERAKRNGHDGVIFRSVDEGSGPVDVYVVIEPGNAKSTANIGTYNREDPDILRMTAAGSMRQPYIGEPTRPTAGIATSNARQIAADTKPADRRLSTFGASLSKLMKLTVRSGRLASKDRTVMGEYHRRAALIQMRDKNDFSTLVHEAGHAFNDARADIVEPFARANAAALEDFARTHYQGDLTSAPLPTVRREGFAEFLRSYVTARAYTERQAPDLTREFVAMMRRSDPKTLTGLDALNIQFEAWLNQPSAKLSESIIIDNSRLTGIQIAMKEITDNGFASWMRELTRRSVTVSFQQQAGLREIVNRISAQFEAAHGTQLDLAYADNPIALSTLGRQAETLALNETQDGVIPYRGTDPATRSLQDAIFLIHGKANKKGSQLVSLDTELMLSFNAYLMERRALAEWKRYERGEIRNEPVGLKKGDILQGAQDHETEHPEFVQAAAIVHEYGMGLWRKQYDAGLIDKETYEDVASREFYAPLQRDVSDLRTARENDVSFTQSAVVKRFKGSSRDVIAPMDVLLQKTIAVEKLISMNDAAKALAAMADKTPGVGSVAVRIPATQMVGKTYSAQEAAAQLLKRAGDQDDTPMDPADAAELLTLLEASIDRGQMISLYRSQQVSTRGENVMFFWENGKIAALQLVDGQLGADVINYMAAVGRESMDWPLEIAAASSTLFRAAVTNWPDYLLVNFIRGELQNGMLTRGYIPGVSGIRGMVDEITQSKWAKSANRARMMMGGINTSTLHQANIDRDISALRARGFLPKVIGEIRNPWDFVGSVRALSRVIETAETAGRLGVYRATYTRAKRDGLSDYEASVEAAYIATDVMDYGQHGSRMLTMRRLIPFLNSQLVGLHKLFRTLGGDEAGRRKGLTFAITAWVKDINALPLSRAEKDQLKTGRHLMLSMLMLGGLSELLHFLQADDPDYIAGPNEYTRTTNWVFLPNKMGLGKKGEVWVMPKPFELALIANTVERALEAAGGDSTALGKMLRGVAMSVTPPTTPPIIQTVAEATSNFDFYTGQPIVKPGELSPRDRSLEFNERTSDLAITLGQMTGLSPMLIDHVGAGLGANAYRDIAHSLDAFSTTRPAPDASDWFITRRFVKDARQGSQLTADLWGQASQANGKLGGAYQTLHNLVGKGASEPVINALLGKMDAEEKAYALLMEYQKPEDKRLHPVNRATALTKIISGMSTEISSRLGLADSTYEDDPVNIAMTPSKKREVIDVLKEIAQREAWNTMVTMGHPTYKGRKLLDVEGSLSLLEATSPDAYDEYVRRVTKAKVYDFEGVAEAWPDARTRLIEDGEFAILTDLSASAGMAF